MLDGSITSAAWDTACTYHSGLVGYPFIQSNRKSTKIFALANRHPKHKIQDPAHTVNMVPVLTNQYLISGGKFTETGYVSVCDGEEVNIYNGHTSKITVSEKAVLTR